MSKMKKVSSSKMDKMPIVNTGAAGIDLGSKFHVVCIGQEKESIREFGVYTEDLHELANWLIDNDVKTIAMESTGSYWKGLYVILKDYGLEVILVNGKYTKQPKGRKSDISDCQWIQKLHALGLLEGSFIPDNLTSSLKQIARHRSKLIVTAAAYTNKMQKAMRCMNIRLDVVLKDIMGKSGRAIISAILAGERDEKKLAELADYRVKKSKEEIAKSLLGDWREEYIFELQQSYELYQYIQKQIRDCDEKIELILERHVQRLEEIKKESRVKYAPEKKKRVNKNAPKFNLEQYCYWLSGVDLIQVDGIARSTLLVLLSETGLDVSSFKTAKRFCSWMAISPNNKITGGKVKSRRVPKQNGNVKEAFKYAANVVGNLKQGALNQFFKRILFRYGRQAAINATARKLAVIVWNMLSKKEAFNYMKDEDYLEQIRRKQVANMKRKMKRLNIRPEELAF